MQGMYQSPVDSTIEGIIRNKMSQTFNQNTFRDIQDELQVILGDNLLRFYVKNNELIIDYKDHLRNLRGYKVDIRDFAQRQAT